MILSGREKKCARAHTDISWRVWEPEDRDCPVCAWRERAVLAEAALAALRLKDTLALQPGYDKL